MKTGFWIKVCLVAVLLGIMFMPQTVSAQKRGGTLVMIVQPDVPTLASYMSTSAPIGMVAAKIYDGLAEYDFNLKPIPGLAESWSIAPDGKTITFKLRKEAKFHDGKPLTSADVKYSVLEVLKKIHPRGASTYREVTDIETPDPYTAIFRLKNPAPYMMMALSSYESPIVPKHLFEGTDIRNSPYANKPVGSGPFKFVEWKRGQYIRLDRNPDYWKKGQPYLDRIIVRNIPDAATRTAALEKGEVHYAGMAAIYYSDVRYLEKLPHIKITTKSYEMSSPIVELNFNTRRKPFDNVKVRQAISYAIDRQFVIDNVWFGFGKPGTGPINSNFAASGMYTSDVKNYNVPNGIEIANKLLDEAGYTRDAKGIRFEIIHDITPYGEEWRRLGEYVQQVLERLGIKAKLRYEDVPTWLRRVYTNYDFDLTNNWYQNLADPAIGIHREYHTNSIRRGTVFVNCTGWSSPETDKLMDQAAVELDPKKRAALYHEFQKRVVEAAPNVWVHEIKFSTLYHKDLKDAVVSPLSVMVNLDQAYFAK